MGYIYLRTNKINGKKYIGQATTKRFKARQREWKCLKQPYSGNVINNARKKYGIDAFDFEILKECKDEELDYWEKYYIKELNTKVPYGYNMTDGGGGMSGFTISEETKIKMSECHKGKHRSEETKLKISKGNKGKHRSEETKKKISETLKGNIPWNKGKTNIYSDETRKKMSEWNKGKKLSDETRKKISEAQTNGKKSKPVLKIDPISNEIVAEFPSVSEVERQLGISQSNVSNCCNGKRNTAGGYKWQYN